MAVVFFFSSRRRHTRFDCDWSSDVCSSDLDRRGVLLHGRAPDGGDRASALRRLPQVAVVSRMTGSSGGLPHRGIHALPTPAETYRDRKSTRLNSSHSQISYAVFCLKKKKKHSN